mmetsp:Transcript_7146/g.19543  ORF Transcript_7146/g.19543 Transcript_7146/m.19543 type:complete len:247 (-) Transcript_7146:855-1595(-)
MVYPKTPEPAAAAGPRASGLCPTGGVSPLAPCGVQELNTIVTSTFAANRGARFKDVERSFNPAHKPHNVNEINHAGGRGQALYVACRKVMMSPSATTYSLPSRRSLPTSLAPEKPPAAVKSSNATVSARIKPFSKSEWMTPAAWGAVEPALTVQARLSCTPVVKYVRRPSCLYVARINDFSPPSSTPRSFRYSAASAASSSFSSASTCAEITTTSEPSSSAFFFSAWTCTLSAPCVARSSSDTLAA